MHSKKFSKTLQGLIRKCKDAKERERLRALYALSIGYPLSLVSDIFTVDEGTVYRWVDRWKKNKSLSDLPKMGRPGLLKDEDKELLRELVIGGDPRKFGLEADFWSTKALRDCLGQNDIRVSQETIRRCLVEMGAVYLKPEADKSRNESIDRIMEGRKVLAPYRLNPRTLSLIFDGPAFEEQPRKAGWVFEK